jgi:hypothetical protein
LVLDRGFSAWTCSDDVLQDIFHRPGSCIILGLRVPVVGEA